MIIREHVPLAPRTTLGVGGAARFYIEAQSEQEVVETITFARARGLPLFVLGCGSNILVSDDGFEGVVLKLAMHNIVVTEQGDDVCITASASAPWDDVVNTACAQRVWGVENLAGIPGSVGGAVVQNIGAYGAELSQTFLYAEAIHIKDAVSRRFVRDEAQFVYRGSFFKQHPEWIITRVILQLSRNAGPNLIYPDLARAQTEGVSFVTPAEIATTVRTIRARKFPDYAHEGTAGSFFINPVISEEIHTQLKARWPNLPSWPQEGDRVKVSLAWILDQVLHLKGFARGPVRLYEKQPLVIVTSAGASAKEVDAFADDIAARVYVATGIKIEREVETVGRRK